MVRATVVYITTTHKKDKWIPFSLRKKKAYISPFLLFFSSFCALLCRRRRRRRRRYSLTCGAASQDDATLYMAICNCSLHTMHIHQPGTTIKKMVKNIHIGYIDTKVHRLLLMTPFLIAFYQISNSGNSCEKDNRELVLIIKNLSGVWYHLQWLCRVWTTFALGSSDSEPHLSNNNLLKVI